jgi:uncharacterized peroxidase-related enzyme
MGAIEQVEWETCLVEPVRDAGLERFARRQLGSVPGWLSYLAACPWLARGLVASETLHGNLAHLDIETTQLIELVVSQDNSCRYCFASFRLLMRILGTSEQRIRRLEQDLLLSDLPPRQRAALDLARRLSRANPPPGASDLAQLRAVGFTQGQTREIALVAALAAAGNRVTTFPALPPEGIEALPDRLLFRLLRPLVSWRVRRSIRAGGPSASSADAAAAPFGYLARACDGLPLALALCGALAEAWASPLLSRRAKGLVFAVVAHGLGDAPSQREAARLLAEEGFDKADLEAVLAHLASPKLDRVESLAVPFARETIWYRPVQIQRRARALRAELGAPAFLELVGISAFANLMSRVGLLVGD